MSREVEKLRAQQVNADPDAPPLHPWVKVRAVKYQLKEKGQFDRIEEDSYFNVSGNLNSRPEVIDYYKKKGWFVLGYGNLDKGAAHTELAEHIDGMLADRAYVHKEVPVPATKKGKAEAKASE